ncbi:MAG TPA: BatA domain-containing protein [Candidatus Cloacimonadota bacterium]|nr:BatA domain-containing protein [Candidatus Cloacimonadota bacterium]
MFNLSFLNAGVLLASIAAIIPLLIHLFAKQKPKVVFFSSLKFVKMSLQERNKSIKLRNILLILIRTLIILLTILALSRPTLKLSFMKNKGAHHDTAVAVILDNSLSMDYLVDNETELQKAKDIVKKINNMLTDKDMSIIISRDNAWNLMNSHLIQGKINEKLLSSLGMAWKSDKMNDLIALATEKLNESHYLNKEIYVISDFQDEGEKLNKSSIPVFFIPSSNQQSRKNVACINTKVLSSLTEQVMQRSLEFEIKNFSDENYNNAIVKLSLNSADISEKMINIQAGQVKNDSFIITSPQYGWNYGWIEVKDERLTFDNRHYFSFYIDPKVTVGVFSNSSLPKPLQKMLLLYGAEFKYLDINSFSVDRLQEYSFYLFDLNRYSSQAKLILGNIQEHNKNALIVLNRGINADDLNWLENITGTDISPINESEIVINYINTHHPMMSVFQQEHVKNQRVIPAFSVKPRTNVNTLLHSNQNIIAFEKYFAVWNFDFKNENNNFMYDSFFPVFAYQTFQYINTNTPTKQQYFCNDLIELFDAEVKENFNRTISIKNSSYRFVEPGIYEVNEKKKGIDLYSVNLDNFNESDYKRIGKKQEKNVFVLDEKWQNNILQSRLGYELWKYLLIIVLLLIALEMIIVKKHERRNS